MRRIVVFGATGEIGGRIARGCVEAGHTVFGISRGQNQRHIPDLEGVQMVYGDRSDETFLRETVAALEFDTLIDSVPNIDSVRRYAQYFPNVKNVLLCGSTGVYVPLKYLPADENHPWQEDTGVNFYRQSQRDAFALELWEKEKFPVTIFQPTNIIGPGRVPLELWGGRNIAFFRQLKAGKDLFIPDCKNILLQSGYNEDLAGAFVSALNASEDIRGERFIISCRRAITLGQYLQTAVDFLESRSKIEVVSTEKLMELFPDIQWEARLEFLLEHMCFDIRKAEKFFNYQPQKTAKDGLRAALGWCVESGLL